MMKLDFGQEENMNKEFKVIKPKEFLVTVVVKKDETLEDIKIFQLDPKKNKDAYMLVMISKIDDDSIIEVDSIRYKVLGCSITKTHCFIYV